MSGQAKTVITRQNLVLEQDYQVDTASCLEDCTVLVINSSHEMAKEMTMQLTLGLPGCSIMYAPTLQLARLLLRRRKIDLVVSSALLPDGNISQLQEVLGRLENPPDVVVVGNITAKSAQVLNDSVYDIAALRRLGKSSQTNENSDSDLQSPQKLDSVLTSLGADLRNDLNNPLQEIVAMVYVAQSSRGEANPATQQALLAIDKAAKNMAKVVGGLEDKIKSVVINNDQIDSAACKFN